MIHLFHRLVKEVIVKRVMKIIGGIVYAGVAPLASLIENYEAISDDTFKVRARATGAEHEEMLARSDGYMTAWMLYQLQGDNEAAAVFIGEDAEILHNNNWQDVEKNK